jgi:serine/threonine protein kinase/tetratricopeptide (TPR) repeat protein
MRIDAGQWTRISPLIDEWLDLPPGMRDSWLENLGPEYADILPTLRGLLGAGAKTDAAAMRSDLPTFDTPLPGPELAPDALIGPYRLLRELGKGGMGIVWLAERADGELKRPVALKIPIGLLQYRALGKRFAQERDILAQLTHPNIARLYDAGVSADGHPYLAMEYIEGEPITVYCDRARLTIEQRLRLFTDVLRAVQYAHSQLIIHRDLKPANILVTSTGEVKLLDFGIAKLLVEGEGRETELTRIGGRALTPDYASPEQITGDVVSTASDVYSLGVILYEMLTGQRPYRLKRDSLGSLEEAIIAVDPLPPSRAVKPEARRLGKALRGDLDTIVLKALRKAPQDRYATVDAFAQDLERYRSGQPVLARDVSTWYRARKFAWRNKVAVASAAMITAALIIGLGVALWQKQRADTEAATAKAVNEFLQKDLLAQAGPATQGSPSTKPDPDLKVRTALDRAAATLGTRFANQPVVEASLRQTIANAYKDLGLYSEAERQDERALALRRRVLGDNHPDTLSSMEDLTWAYREDGTFGKAEPIQLLIYAERRRALGEEHPQTLSALNGLAWLYEDQGKYAEAEVHFVKAFESKSRVLGPNHPETLDSMRGLALVYADEGKYAKAEPLYVSLLAAERRVLGEEHPDTLTIAQSLGDLYNFEGRHTEAERIHADVLAARNRILGSEHPDTLISMACMARTYELEARYPPAEELYAKVLGIQRRVLGEEHPDVLILMNNLALIYMRRGEYARAERLMTKVLEVRRRTLAEEHPNIARSMNNLGVLYEKEGKLIEAERLLNKALDTRRRTLGAAHPDTLESMRNLAEVYRSEGKHEQALALLTTVLEGRRRSLGEEHPATLACMNSMALVYRDQGRYELAQPAFEKVLELSRRVRGPEHPDTAGYMSALGETLLLQKKYSEAEPLLRQAFIIQEKTGPDEWERYRTEAMLGTALAGKGARRDGERLLLEGYRGLNERRSRIPNGERGVLEVTRAYIADQSFNTAAKTNFAFSQSRRTVRSVRPNASPISPSVIPAK